MCGIFAVYNATGIEGDETRNLMGVRALSHRGPDDEGIFLDDKIFIGHRRLSILDLSSAGHQPMLGADGQVVLAFNGQIYNHPELRAELKAKGYCFHSNCDTETLLNMYLEYGLDAFERMRGMWAIIIWDRRKDILIASRDRMGVKPLYIYEANGEIIFASEIKAILAARPADIAQIDNVSMCRYVTRGWLDHDERTMFNGVFQLPPAVYTVWHAGKILERKTYWTLPSPASKRHDPVELRAMFFDAVERHLQSDVPVATTLSGGLDSSSITCTLAHGLNMADRVNAFSIRLPDTPDESRWIDKTVLETKISHNYLDTDNFSIIDALDDLIESMDEPVFNSAYVHQALLRRHISESGYKVLLTGDGGDEVFGGYAKILPMFVTSLLQDGKNLAARRAIRGGIALTGLQPSEQVARLRLYRDSCIGSRTFQEFCRGYDFFSKSYLLDDEELFPEVEYPQLRGVSSGVPLFRELLDRMRLDIPHHLRNEDRNSMAWGVEARPVFVDHELIELAWSYSYELFMEDGINKRLMRRAMEGIVTPSVLRLKRKFARPGNNTILVYDRLVEPIHEILRNSDVTSDGMWQDNLYQLYEEDRVTRDPDNAYPWFRFYMTQRWLSLKVGQRMTQ